MATTSTAAAKPAYDDVLAWDQPVEYVAPVDPQPALHALDRLRTCIGGYEARSDEELALCDAAMVVLQDYFADKDALPSPQSSGPRPAQESAVGSVAEVKAAFKNRYARYPEEGQKIWEAQVEAGVYDDRVKALEARDKVAAKETAYAKKPAA